MDTSRYASYSSFCVLFEILLSNFKLSHFFNVWPPLVCLSRFVLYFSRFAIFLCHRLNDHYVERLTIAIMSCWIVMEYLSEMTSWPRIWSVCRSHTLFYFHGRIFTSRAGTTTISGHLSSHSDWSVISCCLIFRFLVEIVT
jgi:hypothetical protein